MAAFKLVLARHGESEWNKLNLFTGWKDPGLSDAGKATAKRGGEALHKANYQFDVAFTSDLKRAQDTCAIILHEVGQDNLETIKDLALNERNYGDLTGLNKDDARKKWGEDQVQIWRRSYDIKPPGSEGESLEDTGKRTLPYYHKNIFPRVLKGERVLVAAHGNSLRSIIMEIENLSPEQIVKLELPLGIPMVYTFDAEGKYISKEILEDN